MKRVNVFVSQPMQGLNPTYIAEVREKILDEFRDWGIDAGIFDENVEIYDVNYNYDKEPEDKNAGILWYLGRSIQTMELADFVIFHKDWRHAFGCSVEWEAANKYFRNSVANDVSPHIDKVRFNRSY
jgi:hypothetical protein